MLRVTTYKCNCCGAILAHTFNSSEDLELYCAACTWAIISIINDYAKKDIYDIESIEENSGDWQTYQDIISSVHYFYHEYFP